MMLQRTARTSPASLHCDIGHCNYILFMSKDRSPPVCVCVCVCVEGGSASVFVLENNASADLFANKSASHEATV